MNTLFNIQAEEVNTDEQILLIEIGPDYCLYATADGDRSTISRIQYTSFDEFAAEEAIRRIVDEVTGLKIANTVVCSSFQQSLLIPQKTFNGEYHLMDAVYDQPAQHYLHDRIGEWQMVNLYSLPSSIYSMLNTLPRVKFYHVYTPLLKMYNGFAGENQVSVHFNTQTFRVLVKKGGNVQLAQTYSYKTPLDVVYYLLKMFSAFGLDQKEAYLILSGLVQEDSALYKELYSYFGNIHFAHAPQIALPPNDHPHHFFTSIYNLAACES